MIRLITFSLSGRAFLNFMGNEFGHPKVTLAFSGHQSGFVDFLLSVYWFLFVSFQLLYSQIMVICLGRGLNFQCLATTSPIPWLTVSGISGKMECIVTSTPLTGYVFLNYGR